MNNILVTIGEEQTALFFTEEQVRNMYLSQGEKQKEVTELERKLKDSENMKDYYYKQLDEARNELEYAHQLLTELDVKEKKDTGESWSQTRLPLLTRLALFVAKK